MKRIYAIYDKAAQEYVGGLQVFAHDAMAVRMLMDLVRDERTDIARHPEDFRVDCLGGMDGTGIIVDDGKAPRTVVTAEAIKQSMEAAT